MNKLTTVLPAPTLKLDKILYANHPMLARTHQERRVVYNLLVLLAVNGWSLRSIDDGEEETELHGDIQTAMERAFNLDDC